jgi:hypothetical protein
MSDEVKYPGTHAELDSIARAEGIPVNDDGDGRATWGDGSIRTVAEKQEELERRGVSAREARGIEAFTLKRRFTRVELNEGHLDETIVLEQGQTYETSDPAVIAALRDHPAVRHVSEQELDDDGADETEE